ncbi:MAG: response regulator [Mycobacteriaceae bacterium]
MSGAGPGDHAAATTAGSSQRVLVVDDDPIMLALSEALLEGSGFTVAAHAPDVRSATEQLERSRPDVVLLDHDLPDGTAHDVVLVVRERHPATPIVLWTARPDVHTRASHLGVEGVVAKPAAHSDLVPELTRVLRIAR